MGALVTVEQYLRRTEKPYHEYRNGELSPKALANTLHSIIQSRLLMLRPAQGVQPYPELTLRMSSTKYLIPDVCVADDFDGPYPTEPVRLCCEILSPDDHLVATFLKCEEYHAWCVPYCWIIDPQKRTAWEYHSSFEPESVSDNLCAGQLTVSISELFAALPLASHA